MSMQRTVRTMILSVALSTIAVGSTRSIGSELPDLQHLQARSASSEPNDSEWAVGLLQILLNQQLPPDDSLVVDGLFGPKTRAALRKTQAEDSSADSRIGLNWEKLFQGRSLYLLQFDHAPNATDDPATDLDEDVYESTVTLSQVDANGREVIGRFIGSIEPTSYVRKGRIKDGVYELQLGFHRRSKEKPLVPTDGDLRVKLMVDANERARYLRPCFVVQRDGAVPVMGSDDAKKVTSTYIHIHDGPADRRSSEGCLTLPPTEYARMISIFLDRYQLLEDWNQQMSYRGKSIAILEVRTEK